MINDKYSWVKGFNVQPDWGTCGLTIWLNFNPERYREILRAGKKAFPSFNTFRELLSIDAWSENRELYLKNLSIAAKIIKEEQLNFIPCYFNGWISQPNYGGFAPEALNESKNRVYALYLRESYEAIKDAPILVHDICNEPYNNAWPFCDDWNGVNVKKVTNFLVLMCKTMHEIDDRPVTVGAQFLLEDPEIDKEIDVISLHPYNEKGMNLEEFDAYFKTKLDPVEKNGKPVIVTECVWGAHDEEGRKLFLETELKTLKKYKLGFLCHGLAISPVADLHPLHPLRNTKADLYMAFLDENFNIRKYHDMFNSLFE